MGWMEGMMHDWDDRMHGWNIENIAFPMIALGLVCGVIVLVAAIMLYVNPRQHLLWGALIMAFSVLSVMSWMGGFGAGLITGIVGGILAILWVPERKRQTPT